MAQIKNNRLINKYIILVWLLALPLLFLWAQSAHAANTSLPLTYGAINRNEARITFEWPEPVKFEASAKDKKVTITFERKADPDLGPLLFKLYPYVTSAQRKGDGKTIILTMDKPYRIRTFISDNISGIDLLNIDPAIREALQKKPETTPKTEATAENNANVQALAELAPAAGESKPAEKAQAAESKETAAAKPIDDGSAMPPEEVEKRSADSNNGHIKVTVSAADDSAVLRFPFRERTAASVFKRNGSLWVVFNKNVALDLADFDALPTTVISKGEAMSTSQATILRVPVDDNMYLSVAKEENSFEWAVLITSKKRTLANPLKIDINTDPPAPPNVFVGSLEMGDPVTVHDPVIGDELVVTPLFKLGEGIPFKREFIEFTMPVTAQGIVVAKKADEVAVSPLRNGLRISLPQGATLTPDLPEASASGPTEALQSSATLFPYESWKLEPNSPRRAQIRNLFARITETDDVQKANDARLKLAQVYLGEGLAPEAMGILDGINRTNPVYYRSTKLAALHGAANFLMYRFTDAARDFAASELNGNKETDYWRNMLSELLGNTGEYNYLSMNEDYISKYPPIFRQRLAIVAADRSIDSKEYNTALKIFDTLHPEDKMQDKQPDKQDKQQGDNLLTSINPYINFLMAKIASENGQEQEAIELWDKLASDFGHPFVQSRAEFSRIAWGMDRGSLTKDQVIDRLERLRLAWHGDSLELKILTLLGDLYAEKKDYVNAMRIWDGGVNTFPATSTAIDMAHKMEETFILMFNEGTADSLPTLDALGLYYQYRNYAPPGNSGREMIDRLADRLITVDLLEQAATLLDHQMHFQAEKEQRSQIGAKVATIHLLNHQPKKALQALEESMYGENQVLLRMLRNRLAAQSNSELGNTDKALQILGQDDTPEAEQIRLNIYWQKKDWSKVITSVENMLKLRKDPTAPINIDESEHVLRLALAYVFQNDKVQLQYLHDYFGPLMAENPNKPVFDFITASDVTLTPTNFDDVIKSLSDTRTFIENYKARIQMANLSATTNNTNTANATAKQ